jgi:hypothetical protein
LAYSLYLINDLGAAADAAEAAVMSWEQVDDPAGLGGTSPDARPK